MHLLVEKVVHVRDVGCVWTRVACAQRLAKSIPAPYPISTLLAEVLFSQMLTLPKPPLKPVAYGMLMVNLCQGKVGHGHLSL